MKSSLISLFLLAAVASAVPADRWPNQGPKKQVVVITPTSEYDPPDYSHNIAPKKDVIFHSSYAAPAVEPHYYPQPDVKKPYYDPVEPHYPQPHVKKPYYDPHLLRKHYNDFLDKKVASKAHFIQKAVDKTVDVTAKLTQYTVDFITRVAIETAAKLAKNGAKNVIHKKEAKIISANHHYH